MAKKKKINVEIENEGEQLECGCGNVVWFVFDGHIKCTNCDGIFAPILATRVDGKLKPVSVQAFNSVMKL